MAHTALSILQAAREHLADPARWHKNYYADHDWCRRNKLEEPDDGYHASEVVPLGCPACAIGALAKSTGLLVHAFPGLPTKISGLSELAQAQWDAVAWLNRSLPEGSFRQIGFVPLYNDDPETTHADILALYDRAIAAAQAQETAE